MSLLLLYSGVQLPPKTDAQSDGSGYRAIGIKPRFKEPRVDKHREQILREDNEILEVIMAFVLGNN